MDFYEQRTDGDDDREERPSDVFGRATSVASTVPRPIGSISRFGGFVRSSTARSRSARTTGASGRSTLSSFFGGKGNVLTRECFTFKQWLLLVFEMVLAFIGWVIEERHKQGVSAVTQFLMSERQERMDLYLKKAYGSLLSLLVGYLADTYLRMWSMAVVNVTLHFLITTIMMMENMIRMDDSALYQDLVVQTVGILIIPLMATNFTRLVFALQNIGRKNVQVSSLYVFYSIWMNERSVNGIGVVFVTSFVSNGWNGNVGLSFFLSGATLLMYVYVFQSMKYNFDTDYGRVGNQFVGSIVTAVWSRYRHRQWRPKGNWLDHAELKYDKSCITRTRNLLKLYCLILPTVGFSLFATPRIDFFLGLWSHVATTGFFEATGLYNGAAIVVILAMGVVQYVVIPMLSWMARRQRLFLVRFVSGYLCALICLTYTTCLLQSLQNVVTPTTSTGLIRVFNARKEPVRLVSQDPWISKFDAVAKPKDDVVLVIDTTEVTLLKVKIVFSSTNITAFFSVQPDKVIGYLILEPANVVRIGDTLPVRELPHGMNKRTLPKVYVFNAHPTIVTVEVFTRVGSTYRFVLGPGEIQFRQVAIGTYRVRTVEFESSFGPQVTMEAGGFYGFIAHQDSVEALLTNDTLVLNKRIDSVYVLGVCIPYGAALALTFVVLRSMVFVNTPDGMEGLSFGFLDFVDNAVFWVIWIGHQTWHPFITATALWLYTVVIMLMMFCCVGVFLRYAHWYKFH